MKQDLYFEFETEKEIESAMFEITAMGVYEAHINGERIGDFIMAPGWTSYDKRHQYQTYDITDKIGASNEITVSVGKGWYRGELVSWRIKDIWGAVPGVIAVINIISRDKFSSEVEDLPHKMCSYIMIFYITIIIH